MGLNFRADNLRKRVLIMVALPLIVQFAAAALILTGTSVTHHEYQMMALCLLGALLVTVAGGLKIARTINHEISSLEAAARHTDEQLSRLEHQNRELLIAVSEQMKDPLMSIGISLATISDGKLGEIPNSVGNEIRSAEETATRVTRSIADLLLHHRLKNGKLILQQRRTRLADLIKKAIHAVDYLSLQKKIQIRLSLDEGIDVLADEDKLFKAIVTLLSLACDRSPAGGSISVTVQDLHDLVEVRISDQGATMSLEHIKHTLSPGDGFSPTDGPPIALAICKAIVDAHAGKIGLASGKDEGATFWFRLKKFVAQN